MHRPTSNDKFKPILVPLGLILSLPIFALSSCAEEKLSKKATQVEQRNNRGYNKSDAVAVMACAPENDRAFSVFDVPGADSMILTDAKVSAHSEIRLRDNTAPGLFLADPQAGVAAVL